MEVELFFEVESREYKGKWYTEAKVWKIKKRSSGKAEKVPEMGTNADPIPDDDDDVPF